MWCVGDALVLTERNGRKRMDKVQIGDRVQVARKDGSLSFEDVYFFGHRSQEATADRC